MCVCVSWEVHTWTMVGGRGWGAGWNGLWDGGGSRDVRVVVVVVFIEKKGQRYWVVGVGPCIPEKNPSFREMLILHRLGRWSSFFCWRVLSFFRFYSADLND